MWPSPTWVGVFPSLALCFLKPEMRITCEKVISGMIHRWRLGNFCCNCFSQVSHLQKPVWLALLFIYGSCQSCCILDSKKSVWGSAMCYLMISVVAKYSTLGSQCCQALIDCDSAKPPFVDLSNMKMFKWLVYARLTLEPLKFAGKAKVSVQQKSWGYVLCTFAWLKMLSKVENTVQQPAKYVSGH